MKNLFPFVFIFSLQLALSGCVTPGKASRDAEKRGYERAMNQSVKQQYWIIQNLQKRDATNRPESAPRYVTVQIPETITDDGTILQPTTATIRTE